MERIILIEMSKALQRETEPSKKVLKLAGYQYPHFAYIINKILGENNEKGYFDISTMGTGKTYIAYAIGFAMRKPLVVIGPASSKNVWEEVDQEFATSGLVEFISYESLVKGNHRYVGRDDSKTKTTKGKKGETKVIVKSRFYIRKDWIDISTKGDGVLLVFDEAHKLKNNSLANKACTALMTTVVHDYEGKRTPSIFGSLTATLMDKSEHVVHFLRLLGVITKTKLFGVIPGTQEKQEYALAEIKSYCSRIDPVKTARIVRESDHDWNISNINELVLELYYQVIKYRFSSEMIGPINNGKYAYRGFFQVKERQDIETTREGIADLNNAIRFDKTDGTVKLKDNSGIEIITLALMKIEEGLRYDMMRCCGEWLNENHNNQGILIFTNIESVNEAVQVLKSFNPLILTGEISSTQKVRNIKLFNQDSNKYRLLIATSGTGSVSVSFHDIWGNRPRKLWISPSYHMTNIHQATGRVNRNGLRSSTAAYIFYPDFDDNVGLILNALGRKSSVVEKTLVAKGSTNRNRFPGDYDRYIEMCDPKINGEMRGYVREDAAIPKSITRYTEIEDRTVIRDLPTKMILEILNSVEEPSSLCQQITGQIEFRREFTEVPKPEPRPDVYYTSAKSTPPRKTPGTGTPHTAVPAFR